MEFNHISVLLEESLNGLNIKSDGIYIDGTMGGAGHSLEIVKKLDTGKLIGVDQDINAINKSKEKLKEYKDKAILIHDNFKNIKQILRELNIEKVDGVLLDLGVSSHQLDTGNRGFSYHKDAPLDMRMNEYDSISAKDIINTYSVEELDRILKDYGEERWSKRIAEFIVDKRREKYIETTGELVEIIKNAIPKAVRKDGPHPARRTFQAIRIEVNNELGILKQAIIDIVGCLNPNGRLSIITFHSLEDRIVKETYKYLYKNCICPKEFPICKCDKKREIKLINKKPIVASIDELENNKRARSAKLRIAEKI
ncbi:16S rRNA (cytosine(1402)-N(4))-methyltransferase RsmH [Senegalia massiliensis]|uniref:Ribosomal RNA small subunit methyltransferase H n=1 Tax=Senegalia massiliensis TaxID=1720316 RepID=A0A845R2G0_9CLOT|nr:16S rRNA (cytosine(1402)-N(4))-methyltransferase RsmH [Senegalia massiliensis]NBI06763.1 16S rRNA (cytosine(1402)-N(4))-methyltransferase RsmH [Senegalia massiliensis]